MGQQTWHLHTCVVLGCVRCQHAGTAQAAVAPQSAAFGAGGANFRSCPTATQPAGAPCMASQDTVKLVLHDVPPNVDVPALKALLAATAPVPLQLAYIAPPTPL